MQGYDDLKNAIENTLGTQEFDTSAAMLATERQRDCCKRAIECVDEAIFAIESGLTMDAINVSTDGAIENLLEMTGKKVSDAVVDKVFEEQKDIVLMMQQDQLAAGIDAMERTLQPSYLHDPYFKKSGSAKGYEAFKKYKAKKPRIQLGQYQPAIGGTPNLYISGHYYKGLVYKGVDLLEDRLEVRIDNTTEFAQDIATKYGRNVLGLTEKHIELLYKWYINPDLEDELLKIDNW